MRHTVHQIAAQGLLSSDMRRKLRPKLITVTIVAMQTVAVAIRIILHPPLPGLDIKNTTRQAR